MVRFAAEHSIEVWMDNLGWHVCACMTDHGIWEMFQRAFMRIRLLLFVQKLSIGTQPSASVFIGYIKNHILRKHQNAVRHEMA